MSVDLNATPLRLRPADHPGNFVKQSCQVRIPRFRDFSFRGQNDQFWSDESSFE